MDIPTIFAATIWDRTADGRFLSFDLTDILSLCGERALSSAWLCSDVEAVGPGAEKLHAICDARRTIAGSELNSLASGISQTIDGYFYAWEAAGDFPWLFIRAVDGDEFAVATTGREILEAIRRRFRDVRESPLDADYLLRFRK
jgi:hypothetical protein